MAYPKLTPVIATGASEPRYVADRFADAFSPKDFGAKGDGVSDDTAAFAALEEAVAGRFVNLCGASYAVDSIPNGNVYFNGSFVINETQKEVLNCMVLVEEGSLTGKGTTPPNLVLSGEKPIGFNSAKHDGIISFGTGNLGAIDPAEKAGSLIAIGEGVMSEGHPSSFNIGIGTFALHSVDGTYSATGDRNVAVGSLSLYALRTGRCNVALGRDTGQSITTGSYNVAIGYQALSGSAPMSISGKIENQNELTGSYNICIGKGSGAVLSGSSSDNIVVGVSALNKKKAASENVVIGSNALKTAGALESFNNKSIVSANISGAYSQTGNIITVTAQGHSAVAGCLVRINFTSGELNDSYTRGDDSCLYVDSIVDSNTFTIASPMSLTASGTCVVYEFEQLSSYSGGDVKNSVVVGNLAASECPSVNSGVVIGYSACRYANEKVIASIAIGRFAASAKNLEECVVIGDYAAGTADRFRNIKYSVIIGKNAAMSVEQSSSAVDSCTVVGRYAGKDCKNLNSCTFVGMSAGNVAGGELLQCTAIGQSAMFSATAATVTKSTAIGAGASVSGSNQIQLGTSTETTYAYGAVQDRSDARDKADVRDTVLGLDFILSLRPVDFKWDYRDAYVDFVESEVDVIDEDGEATKKTVVDAVQVAKDGSRKRNRYHHGLIAQEVKAVLDEKGIDFGGYQDHKINGGKDVLTLGYEEFIAPIIKSLQEIDSRLKALEA